MRQIHDLLTEREDRLFVGRSRELTIMREEFSQGDRPWRMLHLHGPGGIGKTALLRRFSREAGSGKSFYVSGDRGFQQPDDFLSVLRRQLADNGYGYGSQANAQSLAHTLNAIAQARRGIVLLLDSFDDWRNIGDWLQLVWLPLLTTDVRVCSAGRFALEGQWLKAPGWGGLVRNVKLGPLNRLFIYEYLDICGITDKQTRDVIERFSRGVPFALSLICSDVTESGSGILQKNSSQTTVIQQLCNVIYSDLQSSFLKQLLEATSLFWRFDQDMLGKVLEEEISDEVFQAFCKFSFVTLAPEGGWMLIDGVRHWVRRDLLDRVPEKYELYRKRASYVLQKRLAAAPAHQKPQWIVEMLHLHENEFLRNYFFRHLGRHFEVRQVREADLPALEKIYVQWSSALPPYLPDETHQERYFQPLWQLESSSFVAFWTEDQLAAFYALVPLNERTRRLFENNPIVDGYIKHSTLQQNEVLIYAGASLMQFEPDVCGFVFRHLFSRICSGQLITALTPLTELADIYLSIGFTRLPWADASYTGDVSTLAFQLDLRDSNLADSISEKGPETDDRNCDRVSWEKSVPYVKKCLINFHKLESGCTQLEPLCELLKMPDNSRRASLIRGAFTDTLSAMTEYSEEEKQLAQLLRLAYIQKIGTHETVAARMGFAISTYYRYLAKAIERLSFRLMRESD